MQGNGSAQELRSRQGQPGQPQSHVEVVQAVAPGLDQEMTVVPVVIGGGVAWTEELCDRIGVNASPSCKGAGPFCEVLDSVDWESVDIENADDKSIGPAL